MFLTQINYPIRSVSFALLLVLIFSLSILAQEVIEITENGKKVVLSQNLIKSLTENPSEPENIIRTWYSSQGYLNVDIAQISDNAFEIEKGCRFTISQLRIQNKAFSRFSKQNLGFYSMEFLEKEIQAILVDLESLGFLYAKAELSSFMADNELCEVEIELEIEEGNQLYTSGILFPGAKSNKPEFLERISQFRDSVLITSNYLEELKDHLVQSELFEEVGNPEVFLENETSVIVLPVQERILNQFDGLLGYVPDQNGNGQIVGDFKLSLWNVLNQGNGIDLEYQRLRPETSRLNIGVSQDYLGSIPVGLGFNFDFYQNDTTYQTRLLSLDSYYLISRGLRITAGISSETSVSNNDPTFNLEPDGKKRSAELGFQYSTINNTDVPTKGLKFGISFGLSNKSVDIDSIRAFSQRFIHSEVAYYIPLSGKSIIALSSQGYFLNSDKITENDLIRFGGASSFRGYSEEQFRASRLIWGEVEYRFLVNRSSYLFAFGAVGGYHRPKLLTEPDNTFKAVDTLYSTGFGISYKIRIGRLKFTYAISPEESIGNGKVHLGIVTRL